MTKQEYIEYLKKRDQEYTFKNYLVDTVLEHVKAVGKIAAKEIMKQLLNDNVKKYWIRHAIYRLIIDGFLDFSIVTSRKYGTKSQPQIEVWAKEQNTAIEKETASKPVEQETAEHLPTFLSDQVKSNVVEQIAKLQCYLYCDESNRNSHNNNLIMTLLEDGSLSIIYKAKENHYSEIRKFLQDRFVGRDTGDNNE